MSRFVTKVISSIKFSITVPNSFSDYCNRTSRFRKERERKNWKAKEDYEKSTSVYREKLGKFIESVKVGSFRRELLGNWKRTDRQLVTSTYPLYPARTAQYIVYLIPVYPSVLPVEFHRRFFFFFLPHLGLRVSSLPVGLHAASWHLIFACIPTLRSLNISYPWMLWKRIPGTLEELAWNPHESW